MDNNNYMPTWKKTCIRIGSPTNILAAFTAFIPVLYLCTKYDCWPDTSLILSAWGLTVIAFGAFYIVEPISYYAALGMSGTYLGFLSGNIGNLVAVVSGALCMMALGKWVVPKHPKLAEYSLGIAMIFGIACALIAA